MKNTNESNQRYLKEFEDKNDKRFNELMIIRGEFF